MSHPKAVILLAALAVGAMPPVATAAAAAVTWEELRRLPADCPVIYDNDWLRDTNDDEYLLARAHLGRANLKGFILSKDEWDHGRQYKVEDGRKDFEHDLAVARRSGFRNVPELTIGADRLLERPASAKVEDTRPVRSAGTDLIVREARRASPQKPLVVVVGGPLCTVANAYLSDPSIADRMVVMMTDIDGYNGSDPWANYVVATRCKLVNFGANPLWWPQRPEPPVMPPGRFDALPDREITRSMKEVARRFWDRSTRKERPDRDDGFGDGAGTFLLYRPETWRGVKRARVTGAWSHEEAPNGAYHYLEATGINPALMAEEFFGTLEKALGGLAARTEKGIPEPRAGSPGRAGIPIKFRLDRDGFVTLVVEDAEGNRVRNLVSEARMPGGENTVWWDGYDDGEWDRGHNLVRHRAPAGTYRVRGLTHDGIRMRYEFPVYSPGTPPWKTRDGSGGWLADHSPPADVLFLPEGGPPQVRGKSRLLVCSTSGESGEEFVWLDEDGRRLYGTNDGFWGGTHLARDSGPRAVEEDDAYVFISGERDLDNDTMEVRAFRRGGRLESVVKMTFPHESVRRFKTYDQAYGANGLAVHDGLVVIAFTHQNKLILADARRRSVVGEVAFPSPRGLSFDRQGRLYVISGSAVKRFSVTPGRPSLADETTLVDGLAEPRRTFVADDGTLYVADWRPSHQIKVFSPDGKLLRTIGKPGGPQLGRYDERRMSYPCGMALDRRGRLWVAEAETYPKRLSLWRSDDGSFVRAWYGPPKYGGGGAIDPHDPRRLFYAEYDRGGGIAFDLDWDRGESKVRGIYWRPERFEETIPGPAPERACTVAGRTFLTNSFNGQLRFNQDRGAAIWRLDPDDIARPVAVLGNAADLNHHQWGWMMRYREAINALWKGKDPALIFFAWCDDNDDHVAQPEEVRWAETTRRNARGEPLTEIGLMPLVYPDLSVTTSYGTKLAPPTISARGIPIYDLTKTTVVGLADLQRSPLVGRDHALTYRDGTDTLFGSDLGGRRRWRMNWVEGDPPSSDHLIQATRPNGPPVRPVVGEAGDLVAYSGEKGAIFLLTLDGLFVQTLGGDNRFTPLWRMPEARRGLPIEGVSFEDEQFHPTITQVEGGEIYMVVGKEHSSIVKLEGFESVRRLDLGDIAVNEGALRGLPETLVERARQQGRDTLAVTILERAPDVDGRLGDWPPETAWADISGQAKAAVTVAGDRLYLAFRTGDPRALTNGGKDYRYDFKTGGAIDLMLGTDPGADRHRREPARGDLRLLVAQVGGRTRAVLFRAVAPDAPKGREVLYQSPIGRVHFDEVADISGSVVLAGRDGDFELSAPLGLLGLRPEKGIEILGDLGILRGDGAQTTRRIYWNNLDTGLVSDLPSEARLRPTNWGIWRFR